MEDARCMVHIENHKNLPHFSADELAEICLKCPDVSTQKAQETARRLFPGRHETAYANLQIAPGPYRCFKNAGGEYERPLCIAVSWPVAIGVMKDGTVRPF